MLTACLLALPGWLSAQAPCTPDGCRGPNLVPFGNLEFDIGNPASPSLEFATEYGYVACPPTNPWDLWGRITLQSNPSNCFNGWAGYDHTYGNENGTMLLVDFPDSNLTKIIWEVTVNVTPGETYCFGAYYRNLNIGTNVSKPTFRYIVADSLIGISPELPANGNWEYFGYTYTAQQGETSVSIAIENGKYGGVGNDLAIDDIEFRQVRFGGGAPVAHNDQYVVLGGNTAQYLNLLYNDSSSTGGALQPAMVTLTSSLPASVGTLSQDSAGLISFMPAAGFLGEATFSYEVCEANGCCAQAVANLTIDNVLPVAVQAFEAVAVQAGHSLRWEAAHGGTLDYFGVEMRQEGHNFVEVGQVAAHAEQQAYRFVHHELSHSAVYYRLRMVDLDGQVFFSRQIQVNAEGRIEPNMVAYPNPVSEDMLYVEASGLQAGPLRLELMTQTGQVLRRYAVTTQIDQFLQNIPVADLPAGLYLLRLQSAGQQSLQRIQIR